MAMPQRPPTRRDALRLFGAAASAILLPAPENPAPRAMRTRAIPSSGEELPVVGIGTWKAFDVGGSPSDRRPLEEVLALFVREGGRLIDSSPMYGRAESVVGEIVQELGARPSVFLATKVWTSGEQAGVEQMEESEKALRAGRLDLEQVHNLVDVRTHLKTLSAWKAQGRVRYIGITHYAESAHPEIERLLRSEKLDFLQINYSVFEPEAGDRLLPLAAERGVAVIANRPFGGGEALRQAARSRLPAWADEIECRSWAEVFLKWILADAAVTCAIPGTGNVEHLKEDLRAGVGPVPDRDLRRRIANAAASIGR